MVTTNNGEGWSPLKHCKKIEMRRTSKSKIEFLKGLKNPYNLR